MAVLPLRRTQAERTAETRERLLEATVECVAEKGYAAASTTEIVRRAGVSRGAQVHHFPTKADLVLAAVEWMFERRLADFREVFGALRPERRTHANALDLLWQLYQGPLFTAWLELAVAGRTDAVLGGRFRELTGWFDGECRRMFDEFFGTADGVAGTAVAVAFAALDGAALARAVGLPADGRPVLEGLKGLSVLLGAEMGGIA